MTKREKALDTAARMSIDMFVSMLNPVYRGPKFDFRTHDIGEWVEVHLPIHVLNPSKAVVKEAVQHARQLWAEWVRRAGEGLP
jgi:hypothetical protein